MKITHDFSHLNGKEYLMVHHAALFDEIKKVIEDVDASKLYTKVSKEKRSFDKMLISPRDLNQMFLEGFNALDWQESRYNYYITLNRDYMLESIPLSSSEQKMFLEAKGERPISSYNQTDFVKNQVAVEVQFGKYAFVAYDLFVKHMMFYSAGKINVGVEILPMKAMQAQMSSGVAYYEGEVYNIMRSGRSNPPVPLWIIGIEP